MAQWEKLLLCKQDVHSSEPSHTHTKTKGLAMGAYNPPAQGGWRLEDPGVQ